MRRAPVWISLVLALASPVVLGAIALPTDWRWSGEDRPEMAQPGFDDRQWQRRAPHELGEIPGIFWMRGTIDLTPSDLDGNRPLGLTFAGMATCEAFWNGVALERQGRAGPTAETEVPGPIGWVVPIPDRLVAPGSHTVALRCSAHHRGFEPHTGLWVVAAGDLVKLSQFDMVHAGTALLSLSAMVVVGLYCLLLFATDRRERSFLWLGLLCLTAAALLVAESWRAFFLYSYDWHLLRLRLVTGLAWLVGLQLLAFLGERFPLPGRRWFLAVGAVAATVPLFSFESWDPRSAVLLIATFSLALAWVVRAALHRLPGSIAALLGLTASLVLFFWEPLRIVDQTLYLALDVLLLCLLASHAIQIRATRREREQALLRSARLESELLKRSLQPHFLMNSLTALAEWFEEEPEVAGEMLEALAEELRLLGEIAHRRTIPMRDELRLCRAHLAVMSRRKGRSYRLETEGVSQDREVPPALLHTLVENAITHDPGTGADVVLRLVERRAGGRRHLELVAPLEGDPAATTSEGTGLRYVRARLQEAYGPAWAFASGAGPAGWTTTIELPA